NDDSALSRATLASWSSSGLYFCALPWDALAYDSRAETSSAGGIVVPQAAIPGNVASVASSATRTDVALIVDLICPPESPSACRRAAAPRPAPPTREPAPPRARRRPW